MKIKPLRDRVLVKRVEYENKYGLYVAGVQLQRGIVVATGPGRRQRRKVRFDVAANHLSTENALYFEDGDELNKPPLPMKVQIGDCVEFSPRGQIEWEFEGEQYVWIWEKSIYGKVSTESTHDGLLWQQSAGYDRKGNFMSGAENWQTNSLR